jgi:diguanylate cyclase (GGDEF)-like protein
VSREHGHFVLLPLAGLVVVAGFIALSQTNGPSSRTVTVISDSLTLLLAVVACGWVFIACRAVEGAARAGWVRILGGLLLWGAGEATWAFYEIALSREAPFPSFADVFYLAAYPLLLAGAMKLAHPMGRVAWVRTGLDAAAVAAAAFTPLWLYILKPIYEASNLSTLEKLLAAAYPVGDVLIIFGVAVAALRAGAGVRGRVLAVFCTGLAMFIAADIGFAVSSIEGDFATGSLLDAAWMAGYALLALAAALEARSVATHSVIEDMAPRGPAERQLVPVLLLISLVAWFAYEAGWGGGVEAVTVAGVIVTVAVVSLRNFLTVNDILRISRELEDTRELLVHANETLRDKSRTLHLLLTEAVDMSRRDSLTGLLNHASILEELALALRQHRPVVALLDIDHMKRINDTLGHRAGDEVLKTLAARLKALPGVTAGRYGGDEFIAFMEGPEGAEHFFSQLVRQLGRLEIEEARVAATVSIGWASTPEDGTTALQLVDCADRRLYEVKRTRPAPIERELGRQVA